MGMKSGGGPIEESDAHDAKDEEAHGHRDEQGNDYLHDPTILPEEPAVRRSNRLFRFVLAGALVGAVAIGSTTVDTGLLTVEPGPVRDVAELVRIEGAQTYSSNGTFLLTTVTLYEATLVHAMRGWFSSDIAVVPRSAVFPPGTTREEQLAETASQMDLSQIEATVAALRMLGYELHPDGALVHKTTKGSPSEGFLLAGDVIVSVDGQPVTDVSHVSELIGKQDLSETVKIGYRRDGQALQSELKVAAQGSFDPSSETPDRLVIGVEIIQSYRLPFEVRIDAGEIGGPSAGLTFALEIVDLLTPEDLTKGQRVADTGQITSEGKVLPIGGIRQKVSAAIKAKADVMIVPKAQLSEARRAADGELTILGVADLADAVAQLRDL